MELLGLGQYIFFYNISQYSFASYDTLSKYKNVYTCTIAWMSVYEPQSVWRDFYLALF